MITDKQVHDKIKEISKKYINGRPSINVEGLSSEFNVKRVMIIPHIEALKTLGFIEVFEAKDILMITNKGKYATL